MLLDPIILLGFFAVAIFVYFLSHVPLYNFLAVKTAFREWISTEAGELHKNKAEIKTTEGSLHAVRKPFLEEDPLFSLSLKTEHTLNLRMQPEGAVERIAKTFGVSVEIQVGDPEFDGRVYIDTTDDHLVRTLLQSPELRDVIAAFLQFPKTLLTVEKGTICATINPESRTTQNDFLTAFAAAKAAVLALCTALRSLPAGKAHPLITASETEAKSLKKWIERFWFGGALVSLIVWMIALQTYPTLRYPLASYGVETLSSVGSLLALSIILLWGRSYSHRLFAALIVCSLFVAGLGIPGTMAIWNGHYDGSAEAEITATVRSTHSRRSGCEAYVESWLVAGQVESVHISCRDRERIKPGETKLLLRIKDGALGLAWVACYEILSP